MYSILTNWWFTKVSAVVILVVLALPSFGQVSQTNRFEFQINANEKAFEVIAAQEYGLFLQRRFREIASDRIEIVKLDTSFIVNWSGFLGVDTKFIQAGKYAAFGKLFLLFRFQDYSQNNFELVSIDEATGNYNKYSIRNFIPFSPSEFYVTESAALVGGYFNRVPVVLHFSFITQKTKILPGLLNEVGELTQIRPYADGSFDVLISSRNFKGLQTIWIKNYDSEGNLQQNSSLDPESNKHLIFGRSVKTSNNVQVVAGVYGNRNSEYSRGFFLASLDPSGMEQLRYYNYADLENFFRYMKAKREERVKNRIHRKKIKGKKIRLNYRLLVHEIVPYNDQFILLGEAFYPSYINTMGNSRIFDGFRYTHAVVMGFDQNGKLLWDNSFEINDVKAFTLEQFVKLEVIENKIALLYLFNNELRSKIIQDNMVLEGKTIEPIKTNDTNKIIKREEPDFNKLDYWYGNYFYAHGIHEVTSPGSGKRRVFFINKIRYN